MIPPCARGINQKMPNCDGRALGFWNDNLPQSSVSGSRLLLNINIIQQHSNWRAKGQRNLTKTCFAMFRAMFSCRICCRKFLGHKTDFILQGRLQVTKS